MDAPQKAKKSTKHRKHGRNAVSCKYYALTNRRERNKLRHLTKHLKRFPDDLCATAAAERAARIVGVPLN